MKRTLHGMLALFAVFSDHVPYATRKSIARR